ncbi:MAG: hypothetical protein O3A51_03990 [Verrucomicrobia bacterium]|nr:hypothetical protein [Verrucomicrobiota bacterium]
MSTANPNPEAHPDPAIAAFMATIDRQEDILYGIALFYEGIILLFAGQPAIVETYRKEFRNIIQSASHTIEQAHALAERAATEADARAALSAFTFNPGAAHPYPKALVERATAMIDAYEALFPNRPRDQELSADETVRLVDAAAQQLGESMVIVDDNPA